MVKKVHSSIIPNSDRNVSSQITTRNLHTTHNITRSTSNNILESRILHLPTHPVLVPAPDSFTYSVVPAPPDVFRYKSPILPVTALFGLPVPVRSATPLTVGVPVRAGDASAALAARSTVRPVTCDSVI